jgi:hypothetical protein
MTGSMGTEPTQPIQPTEVKPRRLPLTEARLAANRRNAQRGGRKPGGTNGTELSFRERCARRDEAHVQILEHIAEHSPNEGFRMTAIRDLWDRAHGRPRQAIEGTGPGGAIPFQVVLPVAISNDDD